jgi:MFS family permease
MSRKFLSPVIPLLLGVAMLLLGLGIQGLLLPMRAQIEGYGSAMVGIMGSSYSAGFILGCLCGPQLVARAGHIRTFAAFVSIASCTVLLHSMVISPLAWWMFRAATGGCTAILFMVCESWLNDKSDNANRGAIFSIYVMLSNACSMTGQLFVGALDPEDVAIFMGGSILMSLAAVPVAMSRVEAPAPIKAVRLRPLRILKTSPVGFAGCLACGLSMGAVGTLLPVYGTGIGLGLTAVALLCAAAALAAAIGTWPLGFLSDRMDRRYVIVGAAAAAALSSICLAIFGSGAPGLSFAGVIAFSAVSIPLYALSVAHTNDHGETRNFVETSGGLLLIWAIGTMIGPMIGAVVMARVGPGGLFASTAVMHSGLALYAAWRITRRAAPGAHERGAFVEAVAVTQTVAPLESLAPGDPDSARADAA